MAREAAQECFVRYGLERGCLKAAEGRGQALLCGLLSSLVALVVLETGPRFPFVMGSSGEEEAEGGEAGIWRATAASKAE